VYKGSEETAASIIRIVNSSRDIRYTKIPILWSLSEESQISHVSFNFIAINFT